MNYKLLGSGPEKVLVMHNWFCDCTSYEPMMPYFDTDQYTYAFMDLRGYGMSKDIKGSYTVEEASQDAMKVASSLGWKEFHVMGHSMSGMIAQKMALDYTSQLKSIIAITPAPACGLPASPEIMGFLEAAALGNDDFGMECIRLSTGRRYNDFVVKRMVQSWRNCSTSEARFGFLQMFSNTDFSDKVKGLKTPMLVIFGEHDMEGSEELMRKTFLVWYPNASLQRCEGAGHFPPQEAPIYLASLVENFLCGCKSHV